jgi:three-Cys-motif partner protein
MPNPDGDRSNGSKRMNESERLHPDEMNAVESKAQTEHKLEVMRRYFGAFASIIAQSKREHIDNSHIWLIDLFAGAGLHRSAEHPDHRVLGTALQACAAARSVQHRYPKSQMHVRLVDLDLDYCYRLDARAARFVQEGVDVVVRQGDYSAAIAPILSEIRTLEEKSLSLWLIDPHGPKILAFESLRPLLGAKGVEIVINLDVTGVQRMRGVALSSRASEDAMLREMATKNHASLDALYRGNYWEEPERHIQVRPGMTMEDKLAQVYLLPFRTFVHKHAYPLRSSESQYRYLVHLAKSAVAERAFAEAYEASQKVGMAKGRALTDADCARHARILLEAYRGMTVSLEDVYADQVVPLDRGQLGRVLRYAAGDGYGTFDSGKMTWVQERRNDLILPESRKTDDRQIRLF